MSANSGSDPRTTAELTCYPADPRCAVKSFLPGRVPSGSQRGYSVCCMRYVCDILGTIRYTWYAVSHFEGGVFMTGTQPRWRMLSALE